MCGFNEYSCFVGMCDSLIDVIGEKMVHCVCVCVCVCLNQSTDSTGGSIVSDCRLENGPEQGLKTVSFHPYLPLTACNLGKQCRR